MIQRTQKPRSLSWFRGAVSEHRRGIVRGTVLVLAVTVVALVTLIPTRGSANFVGCDCGSFSYTGALAYDPTEFMTITGAFEGCASAGAHDSCGVSADVSICNSTSINESELLDDCGGNLPTVVLPGAVIKTAETCTHGIGKASGTGSFTAAASQSAMSASFATGSSFFSRGRITPANENCCPPMSCASGSASLKTETPITITIPFELCKEQLVTVNAFLVLGGSCGPGVDLLSGSWELAGHIGSVNLSDVGTDEDTKVFTLDPGEYTFSATYAMFESDGASAFCFDPFVLNICERSDSLDVNVSFDAP